MCTNFQENLQLVWEKKHHFPRIDDFNRSHSHGCLGENHGPKKQKSPPNLGVAT